jgi:PAS domain-containing protein
MQPIGSDLDERWTQLLDGGLDDTGRQELLAIAAAELNRVVAERDGECRGLLDAIGTVVNQPISDQLWEDANRAFEFALGVNPARMINWLVQDAAIPPRLAAIRPLLEPTAAAFLTDLLVAYGDRLERASYLSVTRSEHDWRLINREITEDRSTGRVTVRLKISKYNGEMVVIEGRPDSILTLADAVLTAVNAVADRTAFTQDLGAFMETLEQTITMFSAEPLTDEEEDTPEEESTTAVVGRAVVPPGPPAPTPYR